jgi:hypothetical protein
VVSRKVSQLSITFTLDISPDFALYPISGVLRDRRQSKSKSVFKVLPLVHCVPRIMQKLHKWYYHACVYGLNFVEAKIPRDIFNTLDFDLNVELAKLHTIYHLQMLDITMMTVWCM